MKRRNLFITASLSMLLGLGVVAGAATMVNTKQATKVEAYNKNVKNGVFVKTGWEGGTQYAELSFSSTTGRWTGSADIPSGVTFYVYAYGCKNDNNYNRQIGYCGENGGGLSQTDCISHTSNRRDGIVTTAHATFTFSLVDYDIAYYDDVEWIWQTDSSITGVAISYTVTFNANGHGTAPSSQDIVEGGKVTKPSDPTATGYTFGGWYKEAGCVNAWNFSTDTVTEATTLYAKWTAKQSVITFQKYSGTGGSSSVTATYGSAMPSATAPTKSGYHFDGYWDAANGTGTQYYTSSMASARNWDKNTTSGTTLYAKWDQIRTIYYVSSATDSDSPDCIYSWSSHGSNQFGNFPGTWVATAGENVTGVVQFQGSYKRIYKISIWNDSFKFSWGGGTDAGGGETGDKTVTDGAAYWWDGGANTDAGAALALIFDVEAARNSVSAHGSIKDYSICGISQSTASSLVGRYNGLTSAQQAYINSSTTKTYIGTSSTEGQVSFVDIFEQLSKIASSGSKSPLASSLFLRIGGGDANLSLTIIIIASVTTLSVGGYFFLRKKKEK